MSWMSKLKKVGSIAQSVTGGALGQPSQQRKSMTSDPASKRKGLLGLFGKKKLASKDVMSRSKPFSMK